MAEIGTGYIAQVRIESARGIVMDDLDFSLSFFVYTNRRQEFGKSNLIRIKHDDGIDFYALLDSAQLGAGEIKCDITIKDPEPQWNGGKRPVILRRYTGKTIGNKCNKLYSSFSCNEDEFDEGYRVSFNFVYGIPKAKGGYMFYGSLVEQITDFSQITADMLVNPENTITQVNAGVMGKTEVKIPQEGMKVLVLIPADESYVATKDNGIGGKVKFNETILGANGQYTTTIDGIVYNVYGEMITTEGSIFVYVD